MAQSESGMSPGSPASIRSDDIVFPDSTTSDTEVPPREVQLIYHGVDKEPEPFPPPLSPSEQLGNGLPTQIRAGTSARASLPTEIWDLVFSSVQQWQEKEDLTQAWTSIRPVCRGFKAAVEKIFKEEHVPKLILHFEGELYDRQCDTFVKSKMERLLDAQAANNPEISGNPRNSHQGQHSFEWIGADKFDFERFDDRAPRRVVLKSSSFDYGWRWLAFRRLIELATGQDDFCLGILGDPPNSDPETWKSVVLDQVQERCDTEDLYAQNVIAADPAACLDVMTQMRDATSDCALPGLWINQAEEEISLDWHALCSRVYGEQKAMADLLSVTPGLAEDAYAAWLERVDHECLNGSVGLPSTGRGRWKSSNSEERKVIWRDLFVFRQKHFLSSWRKATRKRCRCSGTNKTARGRDRLTSDHLRRKYSADLEIRFDPESGSNVIQWDAVLWDCHKHLGKELRSVAHWDHSRLANAAIMERARFLERGTKRKRREVTEESDGYFRFSHYDSATMPPTKRSKNKHGIAIRQDSPEPYPLESLIGLDAPWAREAWQEVEGHAILYQRIMQNLPRRRTRNTDMTDEVRDLYTEWKQHYRRMPIALPVYVHSMDHVDDILGTLFEREAATRPFPDREDKRIPKSIRRRIQTSANDDDSENDDRRRYNPFAAIDMPGQKGKG